MPGTEDSEPACEVRVPSLSIAERDGLVWVGQPGVGPLPQRITVMNPGQRRFLWQTKWSAPILEAQENFLDALHTHTVHPGLVRRDRVRRPAAVTLRVGGDGFQVDYEGLPEQ
jgi:phenylpropionate dioxygenase-like ring-hydroxylating dioxygenase large terminal subunit